MVESSPLPLVLEVPLQQGKQDKGQRLLFLWGSIGHLRLALCPALPHFPEFPHIVGV